MPKAVSNFVDMRCRKNCTLSVSSQALQTTSSFIGECVSDFIGNLQPP